MTFLQAINSLEKRIEKIGMRHPDGTPLEPVIAMGKIGRFHGERYNEVIDAMERAELSIEQYFTEMIKMIMEYQNRERPLGDS